MANLTIKNGEARWYKFTFATSSGVAIDVSTWTFEFAVKKNINDTTFKIQKLDATFNKTSAATGVVKANITTTENTSALLPPGSYVAELKYIVTAGTDVAKSVTISFEVEKAVTV